MKGGPKVNKKPRPDQPQSVPRDWLWGLELLGMTLMAYLPI